MPALLALALSACRTPLWAEHAEARLAAGDPAQAVAAFDRALAEHPSEREAEALEARRSAAFAARAAELQRELTAAPATPEATLRAFAALLLTAPGEATASAMEPRLDEAARALLAAAEADLARDHTHPAVRAAGLVKQALVLARGAASPELEPRADAALERARERHIELSATSDPLRTELHAWLAAVLGRLDEPYRGLPQIAPLVDLDVEVVRSGCPALEAAAIRARYPARPAPTHRVRVTIEGCPQKVELTSREEAVVSSVAMPKVEPGRELVYEDAPPPPECTPGPCARFDELGVCVEAPPLPASCAEPRARVAKERAVSRLRWSWEPRATPRTVWTRTLTTDVVGALEVLGTYGAARTVPIELHDVTTDQASWSVGQSVPFSRSPEAVQAAVAERVLAEIERVREAELARARAALRARAEAARLDPARASEVESVAIRLALYGDPGVLAEELAARYGFPAGAAQAFAAGRPPAPLGPELQPWRPPPVQLAPGHEWIREAPSPRGPKRGLAADDEAGFTLAYFARGSALDGADRAHGLAFTARIANLHLQLAGLTPGLGGGVAGFRTAMTGVNGDYEDDGWDVRWGLAYAQERSERGARWQSFGVPVEANLQLVGPLALTARLEVNLLVVAGVFSDDASTPAHYWPASLGLRFDHGPWILELSALRDLGSSGGPLVRPAALVGVRL